MQDVCKIIGSPKSLYFDGKHGQLTVKAKNGEEIILNIINDCKNKPRSILYMWGKQYFPSRNNNNTTYQSKLQNNEIEQTSIPKKLFELSIENQKLESSMMFSRRDKPLEFYVNAKYNALINFVTDKYVPILINDVINKFYTVLAGLKLSKDDWSTTDMKDPAWQFVNECVKFDDIKQIPCNAVDLSGYTNGKAKFTNGTDEINIICPDLMDGMGYGVQIIYINDIKSFRNDKHALDKIANHFRDLLTKIKTQQKYPEKEISMKKLSKDSSNELKSS